MLIESMAGKSASLHGITHDSTPFKFSEKDTAINFFGDLLAKGKKVVWLKIILFRRSRQICCGV